MKERRLWEEREMCWNAAVEKRRGEKYYSIAVVEVVVDDFD